MYNQKFFSKVTSFFKLHILLFLIIIIYFSPFCLIILVHCFIYFTSNLYSFVGIEALWQVIEEKKFLVVIDKRSC